MNPSGGLGWHWRAWPSRALWQQTCDQISTCLERFVPASSELLLISSGPVTPLACNDNLPAMKRRVQGSSDIAALDQAWLSELGAKSPWLDHLTSAVFQKGTLVNHIAWPFKPGYCHWLQVGWVGH